MSWDQEYSVESFLELLIKLTGKHPEELLQDELHKQGIDIVDRHDIKLDDGFFAPVTGTKITLSDGRVFVPKLVEKFNENGNHGIDFYEYRLEGDTPEVAYVGLDTADPNVDVFTVPENYGQTDEADPASDGDPCTCDGVDHCHCDSDRSCTDACINQIGYKPNVSVEEDEEIYPRDQSY